MFNHKSFQIKNDAFSPQPFSLMNAEVHGDLATLLEINLLENGNPEALRYWQTKQIINLLQFACSKSPFWKNRLPPSISSLQPLEGLPTLTRSQLNEQVSSEGSLLESNDKRLIKTYASTGSTGIPVKVHVSPQNARYNELRSLAQYFIEDRPLNENRTFIKPTHGEKLTQHDFDIEVEKSEGWLGSLGTVFKSGLYKTIYFRNDVDQLVEELLSDRVGYLLCLSTHLNLIIKHGGEELIRKLGITTWLHLSDHYDQTQLELFNKLRIPIRSTYSSSEVGPIGVECLTHPHYYHVTHSNVIVEAGCDTLEDEFGNTLSQLLVTHLHSYATPLIRYEVGDYGVIHSSCPCGHLGTTISNISGRKKYFLKSSQGTFIPFPLLSQPLLDITHFDEMFIHQKEAGKVTIELGGRADITQDEKTTISRYLNKLSNNSIVVEVLGKDKIDWSKNPKRLAFVSYI